MKARLLLACVLALSLGCGPSLSLSQNFPSKPIRYIVPYAPGGSGDLLGRLYAEYLSQVLDASVIVENRPGAATNIALEQFARVEPDGHVLMQGTGVTMMNMVFGPVPGVDPFKVLDPVAMIADMPFMVAAHPDAAIASVRDMIAKAKTQRLTISHAQFEPQLKLLTLATGAPLDSIPYNGGAPSMMAAVAGHVALVGAYVPVLLGQVRAGKLRAVGIASSSRIGALPDVPTFAEQGFPRFTHGVWYSVLAPKGTPDASLQKLTAATLAVAKDPRFAERLRASGAEPRQGTPDQVLKAMREELNVWSEVAKGK